MTVHACPPTGSGLMPCCGRTPFEASRDRMASDPTQVTCGQLHNPQIHNEPVRELEPGPSRSAAAAQRLAELAQLQPGWYDGEGQPMSRQTLAITRRLITALPHALGRIYIYPMVSGGIELEWRDHTGTHSIEINPDDTLFLLSDDPPAPDAASQSRTTPDDPAASGDAADNPARCVECGSPKVAYRNYREQPFCWPCADGGATVATPRNDADLRDQLRAIFTAKDGKLPTWMKGGADTVGALVDELLAVVDAALPERAQAAIRTLEQQVVVRDRRLAEVRAALASTSEDRDRAQIVVGTVSALAEEWFRAVQAGQRGTLWKRAATELRTTLDHAIVGTGQADEEPAP